MRALPKTTKISMELLRLLQRIEAYFFEPFYIIYSYSFNFNYFNSVSFCAVDSKGWIN